jgi:hypothetical protein
MVREDLHQCAIPLMVTTIIITIKEIRLMFKLFSWCHSTTSTNSPDSTHLLYTEVFYRTARSGIKVGGFREE